MTEAIETPKADLKENEQVLVEQMKFFLKGLNRSKERAVNRVVENASSDWALLGDLAEAYGRENVRLSVEFYIDVIEAGVNTAAEALEQWRKRVMDDLVNARTGNSSSGASNLIKKEELEATQMIYRQLDSFDMILNRKK